MINKVLKRLFGPGPANETPRARRVDTPPFALDVSAVEDSTDGYPRWNWDHVQRWCGEQAGDAAQAAAWLDAERAWLWRLKQALGPGFSLLESDQAFLLSSLPERRAHLTLEFVERSQQRILQLLPGIAMAPQTGKEILVVLDDIDSYYAYVAHFYPEDGEFAASGGMYIGSGCGHFVTVKDELQRIEPVIVHELLHGALSHLPIPLWLNEGLAVNVEHRFAGGRLSEFSPQELHQMHAEFWNASTVQEFWSGASFSRADEGNLLSYDLGRILVAQFSTDMDTFSAFALAAKQEDGGRAAAARHLDVKLGSAVCTIFGLPYSPEWEPRGN